MSLPVHLVDSLAGTVPGSVVEVTGDEAHHAVAVRRLREGEQVVLTDGLGTSATGAVASTGKRVFAVRVDSLRAGLTTLMMQQLILLGTFFVLPVYLQVVLGLDAFETGKRLFPMSVAMFIAAMAGPRLAAGLAPKRIAQAGLVALAVAAVALALRGSVLVVLLAAALTAAGLRALGWG